MTVEAATAVDVASSETLAVDARTAASVSETLAAPPSGGPLATGRATLRAGRGEDYHELVPVDPQLYVVGEEIARGAAVASLHGAPHQLGHEGLVQCAGIVRLGPLGARLHEGKAALGAEPGGISAAGGCGAQGFQALARTRVKGA